MEFIRYICGDGNITNRNRSGFSILHLLDGVFSHMVDKKSGGDKEKVVKVEKY
jgi:hypothetical protein